MEIRNHYRLLIRRTDGSSSEETFSFDGDDFQSAQGQLVSRTYELAADETVSSVAAWVVKPDLLDWVGQCFGHEKDRVEMSKIGG